MSDRESSSRIAVVGRLAPSPTGRLHLGHARSFLLAWWHARSRGGTIVLRMEDLDRERVKPGMSDTVLRDLEWLGLDWDGPAHVQSSDTQPMRDAVRALVERGLAYPCICSRKEILLAQSAPHAGEEELRYPGTCRGRFTSLEEAERALASDERAVTKDERTRASDELAQAHDTRTPAKDVRDLSKHGGAQASGERAPREDDLAPPKHGRAHAKNEHDATKAEHRTARAPAIRFRVEPGSVRVDDAFAGTFTFDVARESGDFPIARGADAFAYQLAVVVDDARAGVTEIVRGDDLLPSAARQKLLQSALALPHPRWYHVPLVVDASGRRLAKRSDDLALETLRSRGVDARALVAWIARRSGFDARIERATARELAASFDMNSVPHAPLAVAAEDLAELDRARS